MNKNVKQTSPDDPAFNEIKQSIDALKFGTVTIKVHAENPIYRKDIVNICMKKGEQNKFISRRAH